MSSSVKIGIIGGSGLDDPKILENIKERSIKTPYGDPSDNIVEGTINGVHCAVLARHGRRHTLCPHIVNYRANIWALRSVGCTHIIASTATGSLRDEIPPGSLVVMSDFIDRTNNRHQSFYDGKNDSPAGVCHIPMAPAFCPQTRKCLIKAVEAAQLKAVENGVCITIQGPRFSSHAESLMYRGFGGDLINMTTVPEVVLAKEAGLCYAAIALVTDYDSWKVTGEKVCVSDVLSTFKRNAEKVKLVLKEAVGIIASEDWTDTINELKETVKGSIMLHE